MRSPRYSLLLAALFLSQLSFSADSVPDTTTYKALQKIVWEALEKKFELSKNSIRTKGPGEAQRNINIWDYERTKNLRNPARWFTESLKFKIAMTLATGTADYQLECAGRLDQERAADQPWGMLKKVEKSASKPVPKADFKASCALKRVAGQEPNTISQMTGKSWDDISLDAVDWSPFQKPETTAAGPALPAGNDRTTSAD